MKAVILEKKDGYAAALTDDGRIVRVKNPNDTIGTVIQMKKGTPNIIKKAVIWSAAAAAVLMVGGVGAWAYVSPYSYVSLDVNPSLEYTINRFDKVLSVKAVNDDGEQILQQIQLDALTFMGIEEALAKTVEEIAAQGYFEGDTPGNIMIATSSEDTQKADTLVETITHSVNGVLDLITDEEQAADSDEGEAAEAPEEGGIQLEVISAGEELVAQARQLNVTPGKLNLVQKLQESAADPGSINMEEWLSKPVKDIMAATTANKKANNKQSQQQTQEQVQEPVQEQNQEQTQSQTQEQNQEQTKEQTQQQNQEQTQAQTQEQNQEQTPAQSQNQNGNARSGSDAAAAPAQSNVDSESTSSSKSANANSNKPEANGSSGKQNGR